MQQSIPGIKTDDLQLISPIPEAIRPRLEEIATLAALRPLSVDIVGHATPELRTRFIDGYLKSPKLGNTNEWLIALNEVTIGYAAAWNGWLAVEQEQLEPALELLFMDPRYEHLAEQAKEKILPLIPQLKED